MKLLKKILNKALNILFYLCLFIMLWVVVQIFCFTFFRIPTDSMEPALIPGDNIVVNKMVGGARLFDVFKSLNREEINIYRLETVHESHPVRVECIFNTFERLYTFTEIPDSITQISIEASKPYRYIRFQAPPDARPNIAEMRFRGVDHLKDAVWLTGNIICKDIDSGKAMLAFDNTYSTYTQTPIDNYWFGLDLGKNNNSILNGVEFCMRHDMNMIEIGDNYELFYYDFFKDYRLNL